MDVELRILNKDYEQIAVIKDFSSLQWNQKYYEIGSFALQVGKKYTPLLPTAAYVYRVGTDVLGIIDRPNIKDAYMMQGRFAESLLQKRVIERRVTYTGTVEDVCRSVVDEFCISNPIPMRNIPRLSLGERAGLGAEITAQLYGETVYDAVQSLLNANEMAFRIRYDFQTDTLYFEVYQGLDRTQDQTDNPWCVFSKDFYNVISEEYTSTRDTRNFCYVVNGNEDNNEDEWVIEIDRSNGGERNEVWVQDNTRLTEDMTEEEFEAAIRQTGENKLAEYNIEDTVEAEIAVGNAAEYGLGDKCTYTSSEFGITLARRITEIREVYEPNKVSTTVIIGKDQITESQKILREVM